ncbi:MAG: bestrophin family ion channel [Bacteroidota bacterium]
MIKYNTHDWFKLIFQFHKSDTFRRLLPSMFLVAIYATGIAVLEIEIWDLRYKSTTALHSLLGMVISLLLVFRTNTAYERWWEGRKLWGSLVNSSRNLAMKLNAMIAADDIVSRNELQRLIALYPEVLKLHLRDSKHEAYSHIIHQPNAVAYDILKYINELYKQQKLTGDQLIILNTELNTMADVCGACERIRKTPIPYSYSMFLKKFIFVYVMTIPFGFIREFGYLIIPAVTFVFYVLVSLEIIAEEIEDPFGEDSNDLPTDEIALTISNNTAEIFKRV